MKTHSLSRSVTLVCIAFLAVLCATLSIATWNIYTNTIYGRYQAQMASVIDYVGAHIDVDDMAQCAATYVESEKYKETQAFFDNFIDYYKDLHYLYIIQAQDPEAPIKIKEICAANSTYEKENTPERVLHLGDGEESWYDTETARKIRQIQDGDEDVYFFDTTEWGVDYTLARPLINSAGWHYAVLCVDVSADELNRVVYRNIYINIAVIIVSGLLFIFLLLFWIRRSVIRPLKQMEKSVTDFANSSAGKRNPDDLRYRAPDIRVRNEVQSLSSAVAKLSENMRDYIREMADAKNENCGLQKQAFVDPLTKVKNKAAYDEDMKALTKAIAREKAEFGLVMVDLNNLKIINDRYGHEKGDDYILGASQHICEIFCHSPVYRIGGDEFVALLQGNDYAQRELLCGGLRDRYAASMRNSMAKPWKRYSAAVGMSVYMPGDRVETVFNRADQAMYEEKARIKAEMTAAGLLPGRL